MSLIGYLLDSALVLLVLVQIRERPLSTRSLVAPLILVAIAAVSYVTSIPTAGNDLALIGVLGVFGALLGVGAAQATFLRRRGDGVVTARAGWTAGTLWVLGMGLRFAFAVWVTHGGAASLAHFSAATSITSADAWTDGLLAMALFEVAGRTAVLASRRRRLTGRRPAAMFAAGRLGSARRDSQPKAHHDGTAHTAAADVDAALSRQAGDTKSTSR
jgi:hypothetical protein